MWIFPVKCTLDVLTVIFLCAVVEKWQSDRYFDDRLKLLPKYFIFYFHFIYSDSLYLTIRLQARDFYQVINDKGAAWVIDWNKTGHNVEHKMTNEGTHFL